MASTNFHTIYSSRCNRSSQQLSLLTPFIKVLPLNGQKSAAAKYIMQSVKQLQIIQDSDVIVFNKIIATVQFFPDPKFLIDGKQKNRINFMDDVNVIFNQGSTWAISCGWTGPSSLVSIQQTYNTNRTLLKTNIKLVNNKYIGTMQFCGCSFQGFRDTAVPMDRVVNMFLPKQTDSRHLTNQDFFLNATLLNRSLHGTQLDGRINDTKVKYKDITQKYNDLKRSLTSDVGSITLPDGTPKDKSSLTKDQQKQVSNYTKQLQQQVLGVKWATVRYILSMFSYFLFDKTYDIYINRRSWNNLMVKQMIQASIEDDKYYAPQRVHKITSTDPTLVHGHLLDIISRPPDNRTNIIYMKDYVENPGSKSSYTQSAGGYAFDDRGDVIIDLFAFNKKMYQTNLLQRLAQINDFRMDGFPPIMIKFDDPSYIGKNIKPGKFTQVISILWSFPTSQKFPTMDIYYDNPNQLYNNFQIQTPANDQMLKINQSRVQTDATGLNDTDKQQRQLLRGIISSVKRVVVPNADPMPPHLVFKHQMYKRMIKNINGGKEVPNSRAQILRQNGGKFAGSVVSGYFTIYYFSSSQTISKLTQFTKYLGKKQNASKGLTTIITYIQKQISGQRVGDISGKLISYLRNSLNISFDVHGLFNIPVFRSLVQTHGFPGPIPDGQSARWIDGTYIITHQSTKVDRANIKTTIKRKRLPNPAPRAPKQSPKPPAVSQQRKQQREKTQKKQSDNLMSLYDHLTGKQ